MVVVGDADLSQALTWKVQAFDGPPPFPSTPLHSTPLANSPRGEEEPYVGPLYDRRKHARLDSI